jgi:hypothetical protein
LELIKDYDLEVNYHLGKANVVADALSRKSYANEVQVTPMSRELCAEFEQLNLGFVANAVELMIEPTLEQVWQNHLNYKARMCLPLSYRLLIAAYASQTTPVVCRVSSGKPESSMFYNSYKINKGVVTTLQHLI